MSDPNECTLGSSVAYATINLPAVGSPATLLSQLLASAVKVDPLDVSPIDLSKVLAVRLQAATGIVYGGGPTSTPFAVAAADFLGDQQLPSLDAAYSTYVRSAGVTGPANVILFMR